MSEQTTKKPAARVGNKTTEIIVGTAAQKLQNGLKSLLQVAPELEKLVEKANNNSLMVTDLEDKIGGLQQDLKNKTAQNKIEIEQAYQADSEGFAKKYAQENGLELVDAFDYKELQKEVKDLTTNFDTKVSAEVGKAVGMEKANSANALKIAQLEHQNKEATNTAKITYLEETVKSLQAQCTAWEKQLEAERAAATERSKHGAINTLNVGGTTQGR